MILSKLTLHGFKSFAKKVELQFDGNVTSVIGPNGCGKTNVVDAIRWGLGEQRPSILRTDRMENIIFGGAQSSKPLGLAEVSVYFDNSKHILPIDYSEVVITRRLYRSGESEYLLNKTPVRLKDINDLIMDTGIGADAYSVIELKMVEDILSDKAEDRRKLLEEAAGVTKYKHRLKAAIRKLDATQNDLLRVNDIIQEVERTVHSLNRQVQRAKRYQVFQERTKELELRSGRQLLARYSEQLKPLEKELRQLREQKQGRTTEITKEETELETLRLKQTECEKVLLAYREALNETIEQIHHRESDLRVGKERIASLQDRIIRAEKEIVNLNKRLEEQKNHLDVTQGEREAIQVKITSTGRIFNNKKKELELFQQGLNLKRLDLNGKKKEIIDCLEGINQLGHDETLHRAKIDNCRGRLERLDEEDGAYRRSLEEAQTGAIALNATCEDLLSQKNRIEQSIKKISSDEEKIRNRIVSTKEQYFQDKSEIDLLQGRLAFLQHVIESREGVSDGGRRLLEHKAEGLIGVLADVLETAAEHRNAVEIGLGSAARYLLFDKASDAFGALDFLKKRGGGRVSLICLEHVNRLSLSRKHSSLPKESGVIGWGDDLINCDKKIKPVFSHLLGDLVIVNNLSTARKVLEKLSDPWIRVATLDGELITGWGSIHAADPNNKDEGMVGRRQRIREHEDRIQKLQTKLAKTEQNLNEEEARRTSLLEQCKKAEKDLLEIRSRLTDAESERNRNLFRQERAEEGLKNNAAERQRLLETIEKEKNNLEDMRPRMKQYVERRESLESESGRIQAEVERLEEEERIKEEEVHRLNLSVVRLKGEANNLDYEIQRSQSLIEEINQTIRQRADEIQTAKQDITTQQKESDLNKTKLVNDYEEKEVREKRLEAQNRLALFIKEELETKGKEVRQVRKDRDEASEKIHDLEMRVADLKHQSGSLKDRIAEAYEVNLEKVALQEAVDLDEVETEILELKRKMKALGVVNLMALEEFEHENERLTFLTQQREDLNSAKETLKETIRKINLTARQRFGDVFGVVRKNFQETFCRFFQGGEADLRIAEGGDPLEAQIEIIARPAGKHFRDLSLLSGGERALTAISLLFALYLVKPSPFCILDEIDAPLDDANVERFTRVLSEFAEKTQFIIVTHNKMTMRAAQTLYGVTMEEEGVSKIVSVKFEDEDKNLKKTA